MCSTRRCQNLLGPGNTWKHCDICREYNRRLQQKARHEQEVNDPEARSKVCGIVYKLYMHLLTRDLIHRARWWISVGIYLCQDSAIFDIMPLGRYPPGSRICTGKWCKTVIPPEGEYKWKMCKPCRQTQQKDKYAAIFESPALPRGKKRTRGDVDLDSLELQVCEKAVINAMRWFTSVSPQYPEDEDFPFVDKTPVCCEPTI